MPGCGDFRLKKTHAGKFQVVTKGTARPLGKFTTKANAGAQLRAIYANTKKKCGPLTK